MAEKNKKFEFDNFRIITTRTLVKSVLDGRANGERFCFILGSGASVESGIKTGKTLEKLWMEDMNKFPGFETVCKNAAELKASGFLEYDFENEILPNWKEKKELKSEYYFDLYTLHFFPNHRNGYFYFENLMSLAEPSFGYNALAQLLTDEKGSNLVITTNFDSLVEDALFIYTDKKPLVINHELLADFAADPNIKRPIIAKVHRGLFFDPLNRKEETKNLKGNWSNVLKSIFHVYTPIVIGYGGGDKSLMDLLEDPEVKMKNGIYWCYVEDYEFPDERAQRLVTNKNGWLVKSAGFDAVMLALGNELVPKKIEPDNVENYLESQKRDRVKNYKEQYSKKREELKKGKLAENKSESESTKEFREDVSELDKRIEDVQNSKPESELTNWDYLTKGDRAYHDKKYIEAIKFFSKAIDLAPNDNYAYFSRGLAYDDMGESDKAIADYSKAIEIKPDDTSSYVSRGLTYSNMGEYEKSIDDYNESLKLRPNDARIFSIRGIAYYHLKKHDKALNDFNKAIELDPNYEYPYFHRAFLYEDIGETEKAKSDLEMYEKLKAQKSSSPDSD